MQTHKHNSDYGNRIITTVYSRCITAAVFGTNVGHYDGDCRVSGDVGTNRVDLWKTWPHPVQYHLPFGRRKLKHFL